MRRPTRPRLGGRGRRRRPSKCAKGDAARQPTAELSSSLAGTVELEALVAAADADDNNDDDADKK